MNIKTINYSLFGIILYFLVRYFLAYLKLEFVIVQVIWELTFFPLLFVGSVLAILNLVKIAKDFSKASVYIIGLILSLIFIAISGTVIVSITNSLI